MRSFGERGGVFARVGDEWGVSWEPQKRGLPTAHIPLQLRGKQPGKRREKGQVTVFAAQIHP